MNHRSNAVCLQTTDGFLFLQSKVRKRFSLDITTSVWCQPYTYKIACAVLIKQITS